MSYIFLNQKYLHFLQHLRGYLFTVNKIVIIIFQHIIE